MYMRFFRLFIFASAIAIAANFYIYLFNHADPWLGIVFGVLLFGLAVCFTPKILSFIKGSKE